MYLLGTELEIAKRVNTFHTLVMLEQVFWLLFCRNEGDSEKHIFCGFLMWKNKTCCLNVNEFLRYWNLNSGPIPWATSPALFFFFFCDGFFFEIRSHELFAWVGFEPWSFWSLPRVARITGMHHGFLAVLVLVKVLVGLSDFPGHLFHFIRAHVREKGLRHLPSTASLALFFWCLIIGILLGLGFLLQQWGNLCLTHPKARCMAELKDDWDSSLILLSKTQVPCVHYLHSLVLAPDCILLPQDNCQRSTALILNFQVP
jgi:hypothetical protein